LENEEERGMQKEGAFSLVMSETADDVILPLLLCLLLHHYYSIGIR